MQESRARLISNWRAALGRCATCILDLKRASRPEKTQVRLDLLCSNLTNTSAIAGVVVTQASKAANGVSQYTWQQIAHSTGRVVGAFMVCCELTRQLLREWNWSYRRRITESGNSASQLEETGTRRISLEDFAISGEITKAILSMNCLILADFRRLHTKLSPE